MTTDHELRDALRAHAGGPAGPPPGWEEVRQRGRHRVRVQRARSFALAGLVAVAGFGAVSLTRSSDQTFVDTLDRTPSTTVAPETSISLDPGGAGSTTSYLQAARRSGNLLTFALVDPPFDSDSDPCTTQFLVAAESDDSVTVRVQLQLDPQPDRWAACQTGPTGRWGTIELTEPLGSRRLVDAATAQRIAVVDDADLLYPPELPTPFDIDRRGESGSPTDAEGTKTPSWSFTWLAGDLTLKITSWPLTSHLGNACAGPTHAIEVRGTTGALCRQTYNAVLSWSDVTSLRGIELIEGSGRPLQADIDLVAIANSLEPLG